MKSSDSQHKHSATPRLLLHQALVPDSRGARAGLKEWDETFKNRARGRPGLEANSGADRQWRSRRTAPLLSAEECDKLAGLYGQDQCFRNTIEMARYRFDEYQYRYFDNPLPSLVAELRQELYRHLAPLANQMAANLPGNGHYPPTLSAYRKICYAAGQTKPTPLLLHYEAGNYNRLHQDLYGSEFFPLQAVILLSRPVSISPATRSCRWSNSPAPIHWLGSHA